MKISVIITVLNEEDSIQVFIESLINQIRCPDEIIIVDGGSRDKTHQQIENSKWQIEKKVKFHFFVKKGNRSIGRNFAIKKATGDIIAVTDAGCIVNPDWLERLVKPLSDSRIDIVSGFYKPIAKNIFQKCLSTYTCVMPDRLNAQTFLPSSRSIAFRKSAWKVVGGYPEELDTCEDLVFAKRMKQNGLKFFLVKRALVYWPQRKNIIQAFIQFFRYAVGDGEAFYIRPQTPFLFLRYIIGFILLVILLITKNVLLFFLLGGVLILYLLWAIQKNYRYIRNPQAFILLPVIQITSDIAVLLGTTKGLFTLIQRKWI